MIRRTIPFAPLLIAILVAQAGAEEMPTSLVRDLTDTPDATAGLDPEALTVRGDTLFFSGSHPLAGRELWASDGTPEGTRMVADTCPGECSGIPADIYSGSSSGNSSVIVALADAIYFQSCDVASTCQVWRSDGTAEGTAPVTRLSRSSPTGLLRTADVSHLTEWNGKLYFQACDVPHGCELYESDGTTHGTRLLAELVPGPADVRFNHLMPAAGQLFGTASSARQVWVSDGTASGTRFLIEDPGGFFYRLFFGTDKLVYYVANGVELWSTDGTVVGTRRLTSSNRGITPLAIVSDTLYFTPGRHGGGVELWYWDDVTASRRLISGGFEQGLTRGVAFRGELYFTAGSQVWKSDGSPEGTSQVADLSHEATEMAVDGDTLYVATRSGLWKLDDAGASLMSDTYSPSDLTPFRGGLAFAADSDETGSEPAFSPGLGAMLLADVVDPGSTHPARLTPHLDTLLFSTLSSPSELYQSSEMRPALRRLGTFEESPVTVSAGAKAFVLGRDLDVVAAKGALTQLLDGHPFDYAGGRTLLREASADFAGRLTFMVWRFSTEYLEAGHIELWTSDGTVGGTRLLDDLMEFEFCTPCDPPQPLPKYGVAAFADRVYAHFAGRLWVTDGNPGHAIELSFGDTRICRIENVTAVGHRLFFTSSCFKEPLRLLVSDGTAAGTFSVRELESADPDFTQAHVGEFVGLGDRLFFVLEDAELGEELWTSDGTAAGTVPVRDIRPGSDSSNPTDLTVLDERLFFSADDGVHGRELWTSDGSAQATRLLADLRPGAASSQPSELAAIDGFLYFSADDGLHGRELWTSDGSALKPRMLQDLQPGPLPSSPRSFSAAGSRVYFSAGTEATGFELWAMPRVPGCEGCLLDDRFVVSVDWKSGGSEGVGGRIALGDPDLADNTVSFWFFSPDNVELFVKMLDGRDLNGHFWVFYGALTHIEYRVRVEDRLTGEVRTYENPPGNPCGQGDTRAFPDTGTAVAGTAVAGATPEPRRVELEPSLLSPAKASGTCTSGPQTLCLLDGRFRAEVEWVDQHAGGSTGTGQAVPGTDETGYFWFFSRTNLELAVKVLDGRAINGKFWIFYGALTDIEYRLTVTDTQTGASRSYHNPPGEICGRGDTAAL